FVLISLLHLSYIIPYTTLFRSKNSIRKVFSYLIVCHIGYLIAGLGLYTEKSMSGTILYLIHDIVAKSNLFLISGLIYKIRSSTRSEEHTSELQSRENLVCRLLL